MSDPLALLAALLPEDEEPTGKDSPRPFRRNKTIYMAPGGESAPSDPIGDALRADGVAYWKLENVNDSTANGFNLTNNNGATFVSGKVNNAVDLVQAQVQYLSRSDNALLRGGDIDLYFAGWVWMDIAATMPVIAKYDGDFFEYNLDIQESPFIFTWAVGDDGYVESSLELSVNTWYFVEVYHAAAANQIGIAVNNGSFVTGSCSVPVSGTADFRVGGKGSVGVTATLDGKIDELGFFKPSTALATWLTSDKRAYLYNGGAGRSLYP